MKNRKSVKCEMSERGVKTIKICDYKNYMIIKTSFIMKNATKC